LIRRYPGWNLSKFGENSYQIDFLLDHDETYLSDSEKTPGNNNEGNMTDEDEGMDDQIPTAIIPPVQKDLIFKNIKSIR